MLRSDFHYDLPPELIAQEPLPDRTSSRLLSLDADTGRIDDHRFAEFPTLLSDDDVLVFNDTRVFPARVFGRKSSGGRVELMLDRLIGSNEAWAQIGSSRSPKIGGEIELPAGVRVTVTDRQGRLFRLRFECEILPYLEKHGQVPLPPYIERGPRSDDGERYQTVYATQVGAVAAPTAGLHFDANMLAGLRARGIEFAHVTLHVGAGTFAPVTCERLQQHKLHAERVTVDESACQLINAARATGRRVVAVGTTVVRALESAAADNGELQSLSGDTALFIYPGYRFRIVDAMLTNFHLPESSLLMLVAAFAGRRHVLAAYRHAVAQRYRFFSYGDAMFVTRPRPA